MGFFAIVTLLAVGGALMVPTLVRVAMHECTLYTVPKQTTNSIFLVTGANSGLGYQTSLVLAKAGAHVVMACRSASRCAEARDNIVKAEPPAMVDIMTLDVSSFQSVRDFAASFREKYDHLDVLINNAGIMAVPAREVTKDGLELQIGTNYFGPFLLTSLLYPMITKHGRIVNHSSGAHWGAARNFTFGDLLSENSYNAWTAYGNSKAAQLLFTYELNNRIARSAGTDDRGIISVAVHPGYTNTNLQAGRFPLWEHLNGLFAMDAHDGALSQIEAAVGLNVKPSRNDYIGPRFVMLGAPAVQSTSWATWDERAQQRMWEESVRITGEDFGGL